MEIRNIYCVGRNYRLHAAELGHDVPSSPLLFLKPSHAAIALTHGALRIPGSRGTVHFEAEMVFLAGRTYQPGMTPDELFSHMTVGLDLTLRNVQDRLKAKGHPWLAAKGFRNSAPLGEWLHFPGCAALPEQDFGLRMNGQEVQRGNVRDMVFGLAELTEHVAEAYGFAAGDVIYTGTPAGVGSLAHGAELELWRGDVTLGRAKVSVEG